jgi:hypothetical protein
MKEKDTIKGEELERIDHELFDSFDAGDESWIGGGTITNTLMVTNTPSNPDAVMDLDFWFDE